MNLVRRRNNQPMSSEPDFDRLQRSINSLFDFDRNWDRDMGLLEGANVPALDVMEEDDRFIIRCDVPGVEKEDVDVSVSGNTLTIKGEKNDTKEERKGRYYRRESWSGSFQRSITLPETVDPNKIDAQMKNGVLRLSLPKREEVKARQIEVSVK